MFGIQKVTYQEIYDWAYKCGLEAYKNLPCSTPSYKTDPIGDKMSGLNIIK